MTLQAPVLDGSHKILTLSYLESLALVERLHRLMLDVIKDEFERLGMLEINSVQALLLFNVGENEVTAGELKSRGYYQGSNVSYNLKKLVELGYGLVATRGTARFLKRNGIAVREVFKVHEGRPHVVDLVENGEIQLVLNTPLGRASEYDEKAIRERAVALGIPVITTVAGAIAAVSGMEALTRGPLGVTALQEAL